MHAARRIDRVMESSLSCIEHHRQWDIARLGPGSLEPCAVLLRWSEQEWLETQAIRCALELVAILWKRVYPMVMVLENPSAE